MAIYSTILETIGHTPTVKLHSMAGAQSVSLYVKMERFNPGGSVKDRAALNMIEEAEAAGVLKEGSTIIEPTSGNTGIGLAMVATVKGYRMIATMPDTMSFERRALLQLLGAETILTPGELGMGGAVETAQRLAEEHGYFMVCQFSNEANPQIHEKTTAQEILKDFEGIELDYLVCGVGTGGTISGLGKVLKAQYPNLQVIAVEPTESAVLSGENPGVHPIQGIGAGFVPENYHAEYVDRIMTVSAEDALETARLAARREGLLVGISGGAALFAALQVAHQASSEQHILTILPDGAEHYLSTPLFQQLGGA